MNSAVLFLIFNRPDTTKVVFECIRQARPPRLYVAADGPRKGRLDDIEKCRKSRSIINSIDWPCSVFKLFREENAGCGKGVSEAITWFFEKEEQGIILEDDIVPHPDFFSYCDLMLDKFKDDDRIQQIVGRNAFYNGFNSKYSYYMSSLYHMWGWATWRRVWETYVFDTKNLPRSEFIKKLNGRDLPEDTKRLWRGLFDIMRRHKVDTWDYQLYFNQILYGRFSIVPYVNMTKNIGINTIDATHTTEENTKDSNFEGDSPFPIVHPECFFEDHKADYVFSINYGYIKKHWFYRLLDKIAKIFSL